MAIVILPSFMQCGTKIREAMGFCFVIYLGLSFPRAAASRVLPVQEQNPVCILRHFEQLLIALDSRRFIGWA
jgi:hypothetical protein